MTGTFIGQVIPIAASPILTRLYTPDDFGVMTLFISIFAILSSIAGLRYELAIVQPECEKDAAALLLLSLVCCFSLGLFFLCCILFFGNTLTNLFGIKGGAWLYFIPASVAVGGSVQALGYWHTRQKRFQRIAQSKFAQGIGTVVIQSGAAIFHLGYGLVIGYIGGLCISLYAFFHGFSKNEKIAIKSLHADILRRNAITYSNLPKYSVFGAFADNASLQMPVLMISKFFGDVATGSFGLAFRVLNLPLAVISSSLSQVLYQKISEMQHSESEKIHGLLFKTFLILLAAIFPFVAIVVFFGEPLFAFIFGDPWRKAGSMAGILIIAVAMRFAVNPLSGVLALNHNIRLGVLWQVVYLVTITITLYIVRDKPIDFFLKVFAVHEVVMYSLYLCFILHGSKLGRRS